MILAAVALIGCALSTLVLQLQVERMRLKLNALIEHIEENEKQETRP
jgi:hypothetical protein